MTTESRSNCSRDGNPSAGKAILWQLVSKYASVAIQLLITMVLARIISPEQYGIVAIVTVFTTLFSTLADVGIGPAVIQYDLSEDECSGLFVFTVLFGVVLAGLFCISSNAIAALYGEWILTSLCCIASLSIVFNAANMVPNGLMLKHKEFKLIAIRTLATTIISGALSICLALNGFGAYALVLNTVAQAFLIVIWNIRGSGLNVNNFHFMAPLKKVLRYSLFQAGFTTVNYIARNLDNLLTGKYFGEAVLGNYDKAYKLSVFPNSYLSGVVSAVMQPYLVKNKDNKAYIYRKYLDVVGTLALMGAWISCIFMICPNELVRVLYGSQWDAAGQILGILAMSVMFQMVNSVAGAVFQTIDHTDYMFYTSLINTGITILGICLGIAGGTVELLAYGVTIAYILQTVVNTYFLVCKGLGYGFVSFGGRFIPEMVVVGVSSILNQLISQVILWDNYLISLLAKGIAATLLILVFYLACGKSEQIKRAWSYFR